MFRLGSLYIERTQYDMAEKYFKQALEIRKKKLGPMHARVAQTLKHMITLYEMQVRSGFWGAQRLQRERGSARCCNNSEARSAPRAQKSKWQADFNNKAA